MTFYQFAITFRHSMEDEDNSLLGMNRFFFANQIIRDKKFPKNSIIHQEIEGYVYENYREDIHEGFEDIWKRYMDAASFNGAM